MKKDIHPNYRANARVTCACGAMYEVGSTSGDMQVELCAACHPFYTGKQKIIDTARRVEKFQERLARKTPMIGKKTKATERRAKKVAKREETEKAEVE